MKALHALKSAAFKKQRDEHHGHGAKRRTQVHKHRKKYDRRRDKKSLEKYFEAFSFISGNKFVTL
jgi:hypothetical protein